MNPDDEALLDILRAQTAATGDFLEESTIVNMMAGGFMRYREAVKRDRQRLRAKVRRRLGALVLRGCIEKRGNRHSGRSYRMRSLLEKLAEAACDP